MILHCSNKPVTGSKESSTGAWWLLLAASVAADGSVLAGLLFSVDFFARGYSLLSLSEIHLCASETSRDVDGGTGVVFGVIGEVLEGAGTVPGIAAGAVGANVVGASSVKDGASAGGGGDVVVSAGCAGACGATATGMFGAIDGTPGVGITNVVVAAAGAADAAVCFLRIAYACS